MINHWHCEFGWMVPLHLLDSLKSAALSPTMATFDTVTGVLDTFCTVANPVLGLPKFTTLNLSPGYVGSMFTEEPIPVNSTTCGLLGSVSVIVRDPVRVPVAVGVKMIEKRQVYPGFNGEWQV